MHNRYYNSEWCRFISEDDIKFIDSNIANGLNVFCYCNNNPIMYSDKDGNIAVSTILLICGIITSATMITGGVIGGVTAGKCDENIGQGITEGIIDGLYIGAAISLIIAGAFTTGLGPLTVLGSSMTAYGVTMISNFIEVGTLQYMKSSDENLGAAKAINNSIKAISSNREDIIFGKTSLEPFIDNTISGTRLFSKVFLLATYSAYYKNGLSYLTCNIPFIGIFLSYAFPIVNLGSCVKNIINRDYNNSRWELY